MQYGQAHRIGGRHILHSIGAHAWAPGGCQRDASARAHSAVVQTCRVGRTHVALHKHAASACLPCHGGSTYHVACHCRQIVPVLLIISRLLTQCTALHCVFGAQVPEPFYRNHHPQKVSHQLAVSICFADSGRAGEVKGQVAHVVIGIGCASACRAQVCALRVEPLALKALQLWECAAAACVVLAARTCGADCR